MQVKYSLSYLPLLLLLCFLACKLHFASDFYTHGHTHTHIQTSTRRNWTKHFTAAVYAAAGSITVSSSRCLCWTTVCLACNCCYTTCTLWNLTPGFKFPHVDIQAARKWMGSNGWCSTPVKGLFARAGSFTWSEGLDGAAAGNNINTLTANSLRRSGRYKSDLTDWLFDWLIVVASIENTDHKEKVCLVLYSFEILFPVLLNLVLPSTLLLFSNQWLSIECSETEKKWFQAAAAAAEAEGCSGSSFIIVIFI